MANCRILVKSMQNGRIYCDQWPISTTALYKCRCIPQLEVLFKRLKKVKELNSYEVAEVFAIGIEDGLKEYSDRIDGANITWPAPKVKRDGRGEGIKGTVPFY
jgi:hypothetical protein